MHTLEDFRKDVEEIETGNCPARFRDRGEACVALRAIKTLETINDKPVADFWKEMNPP